MWAQEFRAGKSRQRRGEKQRRREPGRRKAGGGRLSGESLVPGPPETQLRPCSWAPGGASCPYVTGLLNGLDPGRCKKKRLYFFRGGLSSLLCGPVLLPADAERFAGSLVSPLLGVESPVAASRTHGGFALRATF